MTGDLFDDDDLFAPRPARVPEVTKVAPIPPALEQAAREEWDRVQADLPAFTHQRWEEGTALARAATLARVADDDGPVAAYGCPCGARDEVRKPAPDAIRCWNCKQPGQTMERYRPRYAPPRLGGRQLLPVDLT